jgi:hypothetical protein
LIGTSPSLLNPPSYHPTFHLHHSTIPPPFHHSTIPPFHHSIIPFTLFVIILFYRAYSEKMQLRDSDLKYIYDPYEDMKYQIEEFRKCIEKKLPVNSTLLSSLTTLSFHTPSALFPHSFWTLLAHSIHALFASPPISFTLLMLFIQ